MISVKEAREILKVKLPDQDIQETIDALQLLVELTFDQWMEEQKNKKLNKIINYHASK